jgi:hypothetical protein
MSILLGSKSAGLAFIVSVGAVWECIAFACSSPQTAEMNIQKREETLMKWVHMGQGLAGVTVGIAAYIQPETRKAILAGGIFGMTTAESFYILARKWGHEKPGPPTEDWDSPRREEGGFVYG